ncbi:unnamed protein product [Lymnaea stagnalis]|uniref:Uncharacterized protein n=1 Tax=Lymnaea stagnalis TaxID=6523 RepID=A0AAV2IH50_LYMST
MLLGESVIIDVMQLLGAILTAGLFIAVSAQQQPIVDKPSVPIGGQFTVTCSANSFPPGTIPSEVYYIRDLNIERDVAVGPREVLATYYPLALPPFSNVSQELAAPARDWELWTHHGLSGTCS